LDARADVCLTGLVIRTLSETLFFAGAEVI
jgi:hypothetical protein